MKNLNALLYCLAFMAVIGVGCDGDDDPEPVSSISITADQSSLGAPRGESTIISVTIDSDLAVTSVVSTVRESGQMGSLNVPSGSTNFSADLEFTIPPDARLGQKYAIDFEITDETNTTETLTVEAEAIASITTPSTYEFTRNGTTTVSFDGQNERLDMVEAIKAYLVEGDRGAMVSATVLNDAYANTGGDGNGFFDFMSTKQLKDKTFAPDLDSRLMEDLFDQAETASQSGLNAVEGQAGRILREDNGNTILVNEKGHEFTQFIEKGLMGTVMINQIYNTYFTDDRIGDDVENTTLREGSNYTDMEHHWDEAFGYFNPPLDFNSDWPSDRADEDRFWSNYSNVVDPFLGTNSKIMDGFKIGRTAIVNNDLPNKDAQRDILYEQLELVAAATTVHYINESLANLNEAKIGEAFHVLSEAWAFCNALKYSPNKKITLDQIDMILNQHLGPDTNFWQTTPAGLQEAKALLVSIYPEMEEVQDQL